MIKPLSIEPIKVPHKNPSFTGLSSKIAEFDGKEFASKISQKAKPVKDTIKKSTKKTLEYAKKTPEYTKKAGNFIADTFRKVKNFISTKIGSFKNVSENSGRKARTLALAMVAILGAVGIKIGRNKKD